MNVKSKTPDPVIATSSPDEASIEEFLAGVESQLEQGVDTVMVDCAQLNRVTSNHINALWQARQKCGDRTAALELINVGQGLRRVLEALDLTGLFFPGPSMTIPFKRTFAPTVEQIDEVMGKLVGFLTKAGVPEVTAFELQTVFYEVATNIRCHAQLSETDSILLFVQVRERLTILTFTDSGIPFNPTKQRPGQDLKQLAQEKKRRGFGLDMIKRLSDSLEYECIDGRQNRLRILKGW